MNVGRAPDARGFTGSPQPQIKGKALHSIPNFQALLCPLCA